MVADKIKMVEGNFNNQFLRCPYCSAHKTNSHRTACYKVKMSNKGKITFRCVACRKMFYVKTNGKIILKDEFLSAMYEE